MRLNHVSERIRFAPHPRYLGSLQDSGAALDNYPLCVHLFMWITSGVALVKRLPRTFRNADASIGRSESSKQVRCWNPGHLKEQMTGDERFRAADREHSDSDVNALILSLMLLS